ncbi:MAG TPA: hypothetical protein DIU28_19045 [Anabaena sp. UBA12330]|nr:hypothetical protein [Aphanizomenon flos-aquae UKL13-PB]HCQ23445.1 hypothetical protein [Anabaena sp. UBA12330]
MSFLKSIDKLSGIIANLYRQPILMEKTDILPVLAGVELKLTVDDVFGSINLISRRYLTTL